MRILKWFAVLTVIGAVLGGLGVVGIFWWYGRDLPDIASIDDYAPKQVTRVFSADGELIEMWIDRDVIYRSVVLLERIPEHMRQAMLAAEDSEFYSHSGLDLPGLVRAAYHNVRSGSFSQGASTITQQVVKNLILSPERTIRRKVQEVLLAFRLEDRLSKDEILTIYLNEVYFGGNRYGVEEAAQYYFGHSVDEIRLDEAALLAGLVQSPARYNPYRHPEAALERRRYVLEQMWTKGFIEEGAYHDALEAPLTLATNANPHMRTARYFTEEVRQRLYVELGRELVLTGGLRVYTTLRLNHQRAAERAVHLALQEYDGRHDAFRPIRNLSDQARIDRFLSEQRLGSVLEAGEPIEAVVLSIAGEAIEVGLSHYRLQLDLNPIDRINPDNLPLDELYSVGDVLRLEVEEDVAVDTIPEWQAESPESESSSEAVVPSLRFVPSAEAGFVAIDPQTRHVLALVGGYNYRTSPFNRATQAQRPTGSAFKPFVYGAALNERQVTPGTIVRDEPTPFRLPGNRLWNPQNSDGEYLGAITLRTALARSRNVVSVRLLDQLGLRRMNEFTRSAGIETELTDNLTTALGSTEMSPLELVNGIATIASGGFTHPPIFVTHVTDSRGQEVWSHPYEPAPGMDPAVAYIVADLMQSVVQRGTGRRARDLERPAAGKTGTTNEARDAWFVGFVPQLLAGGWVGFDDYLPLGRGEYGGRAALPMWLNYMQTALEDEPVLEFGPPPEGVVVRRIDPATGLLAHPTTPDAIDELFLEGTEPTRFTPESVGPAPNPLWTQPAGTEEVAPRLYDEF